MSADHKGIVVGWQQVTAVLKRSRATGSARLVALALAWHTGDETHEGWPSIACLAAETKLHPRNVQRGLGTLRRLGELTDVREERGRVNTYRLIIPLAPPPGVAVAPGVADPPGGGGASAVGRGGGTARGGVAVPPPGTVIEQSEKITVSELSRRRRATAFPDNFALTPELDAEARRAGCLDPALCFAQWKAWALANDRRYVRWAFAWTNQCLSHQGPHAGQKQCRKVAQAPLKGMAAIKAMMAEAATKREKVVNP